MNTWLEMDMNKLQEGQGYVLGGLKVARGLRLSFGWIKVS